MEKEITTIEKLQAMADHVAEIWATETNNGKSPMCEMQIACINTSGKLARKYKFPKAFKQCPHEAQVISDYTLIFSDDK